MNRGLMTLLMNFARITMPHRTEYNKAWNEGCVALHSFALPSKLSSLVLYHSNILFPGFTVINEH